MGIALSTTVHASFDDAVGRTRQVLAEQGFGVLTEIESSAPVTRHWLTARSTSIARSGCCCRATSLCAPINTIQTRC